MAGEGCACRVSLLRRLAVSAACMEACSTQGSTRQHLARQQAARRLSWRRWARVPRLIISKAPDSCHERPEMQVPSPCVTQQQHAAADMILAWHPLARSRSSFEVGSSIINGRRLTK